MQVRNSTGCYYTRTGNNIVDAAHQPSYNQEYFYSQGENTELLQSDLRTQKRVDSNLSWDINQMALGLQPQVSDGIPRNNFESQRSLASNYDIDRGRFLYSETSLDNPDANARRINSVHDNSFSSKSLDPCTPDTVGSSGSEQIAQAQEFQPRLERRVYSYTRKSKAIKQSGSRGRSLKKEYGGEHEIEPSSPMYSAGYIPQDGSTYPAEPIQHPKILEAYRDNPATVAVRPQVTLTSEMQYYGAPPSPHAAWNQQLSESEQQSCSQLVETASVNQYNANKFYTPVELPVGQFGSPDGTVQQARLNSRAYWTAANQIATYSGVSTTPVGSNNVSLQADHLTLRSSVPPKPLNVQVPQLQHAYENDASLQISKLPNETNNHKRYFTAKSGQMSQGEQRILPDLLTPTSQCGSPLEKNAEISRRILQQNAEDRNNNDTNDQINGNVKKFSKDIGYPAHNAANGAIEASLKPQDARSGFNFGEYGLTNQAEIDRFTDIADRHIEVFCRTICGQFNKSRKKKVKIGPDFVLNYMHHVDLDKIIRANK